MDDPDLLRRYVSANDHQAFNELVRRHIAFVYHSALRQAEGNSAIAEDATQSVFADLARKAGQLGRRPLMGWLYTSVKYAAANSSRGEKRRKRRESEAQRMHEMESSDVGDAEWRRLQPVIDEALDSLDERDRSAVLLRFFEGRSWAQIGTTLGLGEDTARKRIDRSLEVMAKSLSRHGIGSTGAAIAAAMSTQAALAAPSGLAASVGALAIHSLATTTAAGILSMKLTTTVLAVVAVLATGSAVYQSSQATRARADAAAALRDRDTFETAKRKAERRAVQDEQDLTALQGAIESAKTSIQAAAGAAAAPKDPVSMYVGAPVPASTNQDPRYQPDSLIAAFQQMSKNAGIDVKKLSVDTSEFPFIVYGSIDSQHTFHDIEAALNAMPGYTYGGSVTSSGGTFALNMIPMSAVSGDQRDAAERRLMNRLQMMERQLMHSP